MLQHWSYFASFQKKTSKDFIVLLNLVTSNPTPLNLSYKSNTNPFEPAPLILLSTYIAPFTYCICPIPS